MNITELADMLSHEIDETGKTKWSAKDVKEFFLSQGIKLQLYEILDIWNACPNPVCACELLGCDAIMAAEDSSPEHLQSDMNQLIASALAEFMLKWGDYIGDSEDLGYIIEVAVDEYVNNSGEFYTE